MWKFKTHLHGTVCVSVLIAEILKHETVQLAMGMFLQLNSQGNTISGASDEHIQRGKDDSQWSVCIGYLLSLLFFFFALSFSSLFFFTKCKNSPERSWDAASTQRTSPRGDLVGFPPLLSQQLPGCPFSSTQLLSSCSSVLREREGNTVRVAFSKRFASQCCSGFLPKGRVALALQAAAAGGVGSRRGGQGNKFTSHRSNPSPNDPL